MAKKQSESDKVKQRLLKDRAVPPPDYAGGLSSGSCLINLACTGRPDVMFVPGGSYLFVGDSNSGKSYCCLASFAEAAMNGRYDGYRFVYDCGEDGAGMNMVKHFGRKMVDRLEPACRLQGKPWHSERIEDFYLNLDDALDKGPVIYVLDSMDSLGSEGDNADFLKMKKQAAQLKKKQEGEGSDKEEKVAGSYGDGKAKANSRWLRRVQHKLDHTGSILVIIDQTRDNVGSWLGGKTRSGGKALTFYAQVEIWSSVKEKESVKINDKPRHVGNVCLMHVKRSRFTGHEAKVEVPIYFSSGIDDVGSCVDYLIAEKHWKKEKGGVIGAPEFDFTGKRDALIERIEADDREGELHSLVAQTWYDIEQACAVQRKKRYV
jgi:hypothetical protein